MTCGCLLVVIVFVFVLRRGCLLIVVVFDVVVEKRDREDLLVAIGQRCGGVVVIKLRKIAEDLSSSSE